MKQRKRKLHIWQIALLIAVIVIVGSVTMESKNIEASSYPYLVKVNRRMSTVTIYAKDAKGNYTKPIKAMLCSPGYDTPLGTFRTPAKYRWHVLMGNVWGQYCTRIHGGILFHSVWYYERNPATLSNRQYNNLGQIVSHGCVRLNVEDSKWIYDNCPIGTTVVIYDSSNPGPLGKPKGIKVSEATKMGWDPTDRWSPGNPYMKKKPVVKDPVINGAKDITVNYGKSVNLKKGVTAKSSSDKNITSSIKVKITYKGKTVSKVDTTKAGSYKVTYSVKDSSTNKTASRTVTCKVVDNIKPKLSGIKTIYSNKAIDRDVAVKGVKATWHDKTKSNKNIDVKIKKLSSKDGLVRYQITYTYKASNGLSASKSVMGYYDKKAPVLSGVSDRTIEANTEVTEELALEGVTVKDNFSTLKTEDIKVTIKKSGNTYKVTYTVSDKCKNKTTKTAVFTIKEDTIIIEGVKDQTISPNDIMDEALALKGVTATINGQDKTSDLEVAISPLQDNQYTVTYTITSENGTSKTATAVFTVKADETVPNNDNNTTDNNTETPNETTENDQNQTNTQR